MSAVVEQLAELQEFLLARLADRERHIRERWTPTDGFDALALIQSHRSMITTWADSFGQWSAPAASAARQQKLTMLRRYSEEYSQHPDYRPEWAPQIPRDVPVEAADR